MPCYTIQTNTVELDKVKNLDLLHKALIAHVGEQNVRRVGDRFQVRLGYTWCDIQNGKLTGALELTELVKHTNEIKRAYGVQVVKFASARYGIQLKQVPGQPFKYIATKR